MGGGTEMCGCASSAVVGTCQLPVGDEERWSNTDNNDEQTNRTDATSPS